MSQRHPIFESDRLGGLLPELSEGWGRAALVLFLGLLGGLLGEVYASIFYPSNGVSTVEGFRNGFSIAILVSMFEIYYLRSTRRNWIRSLAFLPSLAARILVISVIVRLCLVGNGLLSQYLTGQTLQMPTDFRAEMRDTLFSLAIVIFMVVQIQMSSLIGVKRLSSLVLGRYFRPVEEDRIFLFVDLVGSSKLARDLGDARFHDFLADFFHQLDRAIVRYGGEIVSYVGDAVIVTWVLKDTPEKNTACLRALAMMHRSMKIEYPRFEREYGQIPKFRAGLHGGQVMVGECGDSRRQVTFLGDVVNMASRIEHACKDLNEPFLISDRLVKRIVPPPGVSFETHGEVDLKGAAEPFLLHRIVFDPAIYSGIEDYKQVNA